MPKRKEIVIVPKIFKGGKDQYGNDRLWTTSLDVADKFERKHKNVLQAIENLGCSEKFKRLNFQPLSRKIRGGTQEYFIISSGGFAFLVLGFTGKKIDEWKEKYINAFEQMAGELARIKDAFARQVERRGQIEWQKVRAEGKVTRLEETDALKEFVEYAEAHGSKNAKRYYGNLTAMMNKIFFGLKKGQLKGKTARDYMDKDQLFYVTVGDRVIRDTSLEVVRGNIEYHEITPLTRKKLTDLAAILNPVPLQIAEVSQIEVLN